MKNILEAMILPFYQKGQVGNSIRRAPHIRKRPPRNSGIAPKAPRQLETK